MHFTSTDYFQGGMKAVVWTDFFQMLIIISGIITLAVNGCIKAGGFYNVMEKASEGGRLNFNE